jgi:hypothetical protein
MFFIWGIRRVTKPLGQMLYRCSHCGKQVMHSAFAQRSRFTLFFIPLIPLATSYGISCGLCGLRLRAVANLRQQLANWARTGQLAAK